MNNKWQQYERLKAEWRTANPKASPKQYEAAMRAIAAKCGV